MPEEIGITAGAIWDALNTRGELSLSELEESGLAKNCANSSSAWRPKILPAVLPASMGNYKRLASMFRNAPFPVGSSGHQRVPCKGIAGRHFSRTTAKS